jgi:hypothetical protein
VRGFHKPARNTPIPPALMPLAVSSICSEVSALHGPAMIRGRCPSPSPHCCNISIVFVVNFVLVKVEVQQKATAQVQCNFPCAGAQFILLLLFWRKPINFYFPF